MVGNLGITKAVCQRRTVIPGHEPTGPRKARPDDRLSERARNPKQWATFETLDSGPGASRRPGMTLRGFTPQPRPSSWTCGASWRCSRRHASLVLLERFLQPPPASALEHHEP